MSITITDNKLLPVRRDGQIVSSNSVGSSGGGGGGGGGGYPSAGIPVSTGSSWAASIVDNSAFWNTAYGWGDWSGAVALKAPIDSPVFTTQITTPVIYGSNAANGDITIEGTSNATKDTSCVILNPNGGNIGIRTTVPDSTLTILGSSGLPSSTYATTVANSNVRFGRTGSGTGLLFGINSYDLAWMQVQSTDSAFYNLSLQPVGGNIGIGFSSALAKVAINGGLHVGGESDPGDNNLLIDGYAQTEQVKSTTAFVSGFTGAGYRLIQSGGESSLTIDNLVVRKLMIAYELDINKINSINGGMVISAANGTSIAVNGTTITFDEDNGSKQIQFAVDDYIRAQIWTGRGVASYVGLVTQVNHSNTYGSANIVATTISGAPWPVMELVQIGNASDTARQNIIYITASDTNNPFIEILTGVDDGNFSGKQVARFGKLDGITSSYFGALSGIGVWTKDGYFEGSINSQNGNIGGWTIESDKLSSTTSHPSGTVGIDLNINGDATIRNLYTYGNVSGYAYSQQSTPVTLTAPLGYSTIILDNNTESTLNLPSSGLPGSGSTVHLYIVHAYGTGLGAAKYHINGNGYYINRAGVHAASIDLDEGHSAHLIWDPRQSGQWYVL